MRTRPGLATLAAAVLLLAVGLPPAIALVQLRPNVVVILTDDVPAMDGRVWRYLPTIREVFLHHGLTFTNVQGESPLCCPGRAGFLTGQHTFNHGVAINDVRRFDPRVSLATALHDRGYRTFLAGKYMNMYQTIAPSVPPGWDGFHAFSGAYYDYRMWNDGQPAGEQHGSSAKDYSTDVIAAKALDELRKTPRKRSVFGWIAVFGAHSPTTPAPRHSFDSRCNGIPDWAPPNFNEKDVSDKPAYVQQTPLLSMSSYSMIRTCRTLLSVDDLVAQVRDELQRQGRLDNTLLILTNDNGMNAGAHRRMAKATPYATATSFFVSWPAGLGNGRRTISEPLSNIDVAPTICQLAGCQLGPYPNGQKRPDGRSFAHILFDPSRSMGRVALLQDMPEGSGSVPGWYGLTTTPTSRLATVGCFDAAKGHCLWHYVEYSTGEKELYDDSGGPCWDWQENKPGDPCELQNLARRPKYAGIQAGLAARLAQLKAERGGSKP